MNVGNNLIELANAHNRLILAYMRALDEVKILNWVQYRAIEGSAKGLVIKPYVRYYVESHIRSKLEELSDSYLFATHGISVDDQQYKQFQEWLNSTSEICNKLASKLMSSRTASVFLRQFGVFIIANLLGIIALVVEHSDLLQVLSINVSNKLANVFSVGVILMTLLSLWLLIRPAFLTKRSIFIPGYRYDETQETIEGNIYLLEDNLFTELGRNKAKEQDVDRHLLILLLFFIPVYVALIIWSTFLPYLQIMNTVDILKGIVGPFFGFTLLYLYAVWLLLKDDNKRVKLRKYR